MATKITYKNKVALQNDTTIPDENKVTADDMNEIKTAINGNYAKYRQELRDITKQEGFPFNVVFPTKPNTNEESEEK